MRLALEKGRKTLEYIDPELETILSDRYDDILPELSESLVNMAYGRVYSRAGLDIKTRIIATIAALTSQGVHTAPQLRVNSDNVLKVSV